LAVRFLGFGWHYALVSVEGVLAVEPNQPSEEKDKRVDWVGSVLMTAGLTLTIFVLGDAAIAPRGPYTHVSNNFI